ncbi:MAG TPA: LCP family protein [Micromonosporaceae bacterium]|nr:LCP family protein [Micromonosporaceae bacterium]
MQVATRRSASARRTPRREAPSIPTQPGSRPAVTGRKRRRDPWWARLLVIVGALLMMASGATIVGGKVLIGRYTADLPQQNLLGEAGAHGANINGAINMLMVGLDERANQSPDELVRADTIMIMHVPPSHDQAFLVSIPRDTRVRIPAYPKTGYAGGLDKINAAFAFGSQGPGTIEEKRARGVELLALTIRDLTGIAFTGAAIIDFQGFEAVLHALGGVTMYVERRAESIHLAYDKNGKIVRVWYDDAAGKVRGIPPGGHVVVHEPGWQKMSPVLALDYTRIRKGSCCPNGDYDRQRHQRQLLKAIVKEATSKGLIADPVKLDRVIKAAGKAFILDTQGIPVEDFIFTLKGITSNDLMTVETNAGKAHGQMINGVAYEQLTDESIQMFAAVRDGKLFDFLATHPDFVARA